MVGPGQPATQYGWFYQTAAALPVTSLRDPDFAGPVSSEIRRPAAKEAAAVQDQLRTVTAASSNRAAIAGSEGSYRPPRHNTAGPGWAVPVPGPT